MITPEGVGEYFRRVHLEFLAEEAAPVRASERMEYRRLHTKDGAEFFLKRVKDEQLQRQIKAQYEGARMLGRVFDETSPLNVEEVVAIGPDWLLTKWIDGQPMMQPDEVGMVKGNEKLAVFADLLSFMDTKSGSVATNGELKFGAKTPAAQFAERTSEKTNFMLERGVSSKLITDVIQVIDSAIPQMTPALQHGDFTPWHILEPVNGKPILIDCEHVSPNWPRYYDLANFYSQLSVRFDRDDLAEQLLADVSEKNGPGIAGSLEFRMMVLMRNFVRAVEYKDDEQRFWSAIQKTEAWLEKV